MPLGWLGHYTGLDGNPLRRIQIQNVAGGMQRADQIRQGPFIGPIATPAVMTIGRVPSNVSTRFDPRNPDRR